MNAFAIAAWPTLLTDEAACRYLSVERATFESLVSKHRIREVEVEEGVCRWRKTDLDRLVKYLLREAEPRQLSPRVGNTLPEGAIMAIAAAVAAKLVPQLPGADHVRVHSMSVSDVCRTLGLSRTTVYKFISNGTLPARKVGRRTLVLAEGVYALLGQAAADPDEGMRT